MAAHLGASQLERSAKVQELYLNLLSRGLFGRPADKDDVFEFDVPMDDVEGMEIVEAA